MLQVSVTISRGSMFISLVRKMMETDCRALGVNVCADRLRLRCNHRWPN